MYTCELHTSASRIVGKKSSLDTTPSELMEKLRLLELMIPYVIELSLPSSSVAVTVRRFVPEKFI